MALTQLFFKKSNKLATIELDVIITENTTASVRLTENPVEAGANINDHIIVEPLTFQMSGGVANSFNRTKNKQVWSDLLALQANKTVFNLVQRLKTYNNVIILSLTTEQNVQNANALFFTAQLKEVIFAGVEKVTSDQFDDENIADSMIATTQSGLKRTQE